jgi:hypothetical protein
MSELDSGSWSLRISVYSGGFFPTLRALIFLWCSGAALRLWCLLLGFCSYIAALGGKSKAYGSFSPGNSCRYLVGCCLFSISLDCDRRDSLPEGDAVEGEAEW